MRKRRFAVCILLVFSLSFGVFAADPAAMTDIRDHWARDAIYYTVVEGLFNGVSDTEFDPNGTMTRAMFVTVLGRLAEIDTEEFSPWYLGDLYRDVSADAWYAPYVCWATRYGVTNGAEGGMFLPNAPITREQMAAMTVRFASIYNTILSGAGSSQAEFSDAEEIAQYAKEPVESLQRTGVLTGSLQEDGTYIFAPKQNATRAECAALISRLTRAMKPYTYRTVVEAEGIDFDKTEIDLYEGDTSGINAAVYPEDATNQTITWFSTDPSVVQASPGGVLHAGSEGVAWVYGLTYNGLSEACQVTVTQRPRPVAYPVANESYEEKCMRIFGEVVSDYKGYYMGKGDDHIVSVEVPVWQYADSSHTEKRSTTLTLQVHKNIADTVVAVFTDIYNSAERFPIYSAGGYRSNEHSEHGLGLAIDLNPTENAEMVYDGSGNLVPTGNWFYTPGENDYSIPADSELVAIFRSYGFGWGGDWRSKKDYMHFSYFGT